MGPRMRAGPADNPGPMGSRIAVAWDQPTLAYVSRRTRSRRCAAPLEDLPTFMTATHQPTTMLRTTGLTKRYGARVALEQSLAEPAVRAVRGPARPQRRGQVDAVPGAHRPVRRRRRRGRGGRPFAAHARRRAALRHIGVVFQQMSLDLDLSVRAQPAVPGRPARPAARALAARAHRQPAARRLGIDADLDRKVRELSGGNRRKVELVRALLHRPSVLLMDEATVGPGSRSRASDLLRALHADVRERGVMRAVGHASGSRRPQAPTACWCCTTARCSADGTPAEVTQALGEPTLEAGSSRARAIRSVQQRRRQRSHDARTSFAVAVAVALGAAGIVPARTAQAQGTAYVSSEKDQALTLIDLRHAQPSRARSRPASGRATCSSRPTASIDGGLHRVERAPT